MTKLHLGCGSIRFEGWLNIDLESDDADLKLDLREPLPFEDESVDYIFSEHMIEHLVHSDGIRLLSECRRVLKPDGVLRISTPDLLWLTLVYHSELTSTWGQLWHPATPCQLMNEGMRSWGHLFLYDRPELVSTLVSSGFTNVVDQEWRKSTHSDLNGLESRPFHNDLILEASKNASTGDLSITSRVNDELLPQVLTLSQPLTIAQADHIRSQHKTINDLEGGRIEAERNINVLSSAVNALSSRYEMIGQQIEELVQSERSAAHEYAATKEALVRIQDENAALQSRYDELSRSNDEKDGLLSNLHVSLDQKQAELEAAVADFTGRLNSSQSERDSLEREKSDNLTKISELESEIHSGKREQQQLQNQIEATTAELQKAVENQNAMVVILETSAARSERIEKELSSLSQIRSDLTAELGRKNTILDELRRHPFGRLAFWALAKSPSGVGVPK